MIVTQANDFLEVITPQNIHEVLPLWADALEEEGRDSEAQCLRWCIETRRVPGEAREIVIDDYKYCWHYDDEPGCYVLPYLLHQAMKHDPFLTPHYHGRYYKEYFRAWLSLLEAWRDHPDKRPQ